MLHRHSYSLLTAILLSSVAIRAADLIVGPGGAFATLEAAILAAQPGDRILLRADQTFFNGTTLPILRANVTVQSHPSGPRRTIVLQTNFEAALWRMTAAVTLRNLEIQVPVPVDGLSGLPLTIQAPGALVTFDDVIVREATLSFSGSSGNRSSGETGRLVTITADRVEMTDTRIVALDGAIDVDAFQTLVGTDALVVNAARVRLVNCELRGGDAPILRSDAQTMVGDGGAALTANSPRVEFACTTLRDGNGGFKNDGPLGGPFTLRSQTTAAGTSNLGSVAFATNSSLRAGLTGSNSGVPGGVGPNSPLQSLPIAAAEKFGQSCRRSIRFTPNGSGGYIAAPVLDAFVTNTGANLGISTDDGIFGPFALGFAFVFPGGAVTNFVDLDTNGRLMPAGSTTGSLFDPSRTRFLNDAWPTIAPFWSDFDVRTVGAIRFATAPGVAVFTWDGIPQFGGSAPLTVQAVLRADGSITFNFVGTAVFDGSIGASGQSNVLVGISPGNAIVDPGPTDFLTQTANARVVYEFWDGLTNPLDLQLTLGSITQPVLGCGGPLDLSLDGVPASTSLAAVRFGVPIAPIDLTGIPGLGLDGCVLYVGESFYSPQFAPTPGVTRVLRITPFTSPSLNGAVIHAQVTIIAPNTTQLGVALSNPLRITFGS